MLQATSPFGHWVGCTHSVRQQNRVAFIALTAPYNPSLVSDRGVVLHEMVHSYLIERGEVPAHEGAPSCREITRLSALLRRPDIKAEAQKVQRVNGKVARVLPAGSIERGVAARWPHSVGIDLGSLLRVARVTTPPAGRRLEADAASTVTQPAPTIAIVGAVTVPTQRATHPNGGADHGVFPK